MPRLAIRLPNGKRVGLRCYMESWRKLREMPADARVRGWDHFATDAGYVLRELRFGIHDRINRHVPGYGIGRKWDSDWQRDVANTARQVNTPRLIVRPGTVAWHLRDRLMHRLTLDD